MRLSDITFNDASLQSLTQTAEDLILVFELWDARVAQLVFNDCHYVCSTSFAFGADLESFVEVPASKLLQQVVPGFITREEAIPWALAHYKHFVLRNPEHVNAVLEVVAATVEVSLIAP
jgi:hypothetical protein